MNSIYIGKYYKSLTHEDLIYTFFSYKKTIFLPEPSFSYHNAKNLAEIFLIFCLTFISLFYLIACTIKFNTNNKHHSLMYMLTMLCYVKYVMKELPLIMKTKKNFK